MHETGTEPAALSLSELMLELARPPRVGPPAEPPSPGARFGRFEVVRELGRGGFGVVLEAEDPLLHRRVALKVILPGAGLDRPGGTGLEEAAACGRLSHPNVVQLHEVGTCDAGPFLVFELLRGESLEARLRRAPLGAAEAARVVLGVARGLAAAHAQGVVHRDLKPSNVFLCEDGQVKVLDFGLALVFGRRRAVSGGTPGWMAPEQRRGAPEDERTDVWALGAVGFGALTRRDPARSTLAIPDAPALAALLGRMLEPDPVKRPRDGREVVAALEPIVRDLEGAGALRVRTRPRVLRRALAAIAAVAAVVSLATGGWLLTRRAPAGHPRLLTAVADVANHTGDPELDALSGLLVSALERSRVLAIVTRTRMHDALRALGKRDVERIDEPLAVEAARHAGARALVTWSVQRLGEAHVLELRALEPGADSYLFTLEERAASKAELLPALDRLAERTRRAFREGEAEVAAARVPVAQAVTSNLEAYRHYFHAQELAATLRFEESVAEYQRALDLDPAFALAAYEVAFRGEHYPVPLERRRSAIKVALAGLDRVPEQTRLHIRAWAAHMDGDDDGALALYREATGRFPADSEGYYLLGDIHFHRGRFEEALPWFERAAALDPGFTLRTQHLTFLLTVFDRGQEALAALERALALSPDDLRLSFELAFVRVWTGEFDEAVATARRLAALHPGAASEKGLVRILMHTGRPAEAEAAVRGAKTLAAENRTGFLVGTLLAQGRVRDALGEAAALSAEGRASVDFLAAVVRGDRAAAVAAAAGHTPKPGVALASQAALLLQVGALPEAERLLEEGRLRAAEASCAGNLWENCNPRHLGVARAMLRFRRGEREEALAALRALSAAQHDGASYYLGLAASEAGRDLEAHEALRRFERVTPKSSLQIPRTALLQARALERLGREDEARAALGRFLAMWAHADEGLPWLEEGRAMAARLGVRPP